LLSLALATLIASSSPCASAGAEADQPALAAPAPNTLQPSAQQPSTTQAAPPRPPGSQPAAVQPEPADPRKGDLAYEQSRKLLGAVEAILADAHQQRRRAKTLPSEDSYILPPLWQETREDRERNVRKLLDAALEIITEAPIVSLQQKLLSRRQAIASLRERISERREHRLRAPEEGLMPGVLTETQSSIDDQIVELEKRIKTNEEDIGHIKKQIGEALKASGVEIQADQLDLLLDSVLGSDLIKMVTAFEAARAIDQRLGELLSKSSEDLKAARRYFALHTALFAMLVHTQDMLIERIDTVYLAKLKALLTDIHKTRDESVHLKEGPNRPDQLRALEANLKSQDFAEKVAAFYRDYLLTQRKQLVEARQKTLRDLQIADNTFETVDVSFQLRALMDDAKASFEALQRLEAPGFDQIFRNESLRKEFENLTQKLGPSS
jgi:cell division protein FtsL